MTDSSRPSLPSPSDTDRSAASEHESVPTDASCPDPASATPTSIDAARENIPEPFREAVSALRKQTQTAAETIRALRAENQRLREKVEELSQRPDVRDNDAFAHFDDDRDALRERIQHFIDAIDDHLDSAPESGVASGKIEAAPLHAPTDPPRNAHAEAARDDAGDDAGAADDPPDTGSPDNDSRDDILDADLEVDEAQNEDIQNEDIQAEDTNHETDPLANGLPAAAQFEIEVPSEINGPTSKTSAASADDSSESPGESTDLSDRTASEEPLLIAPGLSPRRSARRSTRRGRGR